MKKWTLLAVFAMACVQKGGTSSTPDNDDLASFDQFSRWGQGMAGFTAPPSNQVAGGGTDGGGDSGGDDGGGDDGTDADGGSGELGACYLEGECMGVTEEDVCVSAGGDWYEGEDCDDWWDDSGDWDAKGGSSTPTIDLDPTTPDYTAGGVQ